MGDDDSGTALQFQAGSKLERDMCGVGPTRAHRSRSEYATPRKVTEVTRDLRMGKRTEAETMAARISEGPCRFPCGLT